MTVTLSNGATIVIAAGALSWRVNVPVGADDDVYVDPSSVERQHQRHQRRRHRHRDRTRRRR